MTASNDKRRSVAFYHSAASSSTSLLEQWSGAGRQAVCAYLYEELVYTAAWSWRGV
jgi:hypothetical protein